MFPSNCYFYIKSVKNGYVLDVYNGETSADTELIVWPQKYNDSENQLWRYEGGYLINKKSNMVIDVRGGDMKADTPIIQYDRKLTAAANQRWSYSDGFVHPQSNHDLVLDIRGDSDKKGSKVILFKRKHQDNTNQKWNIEPYGASANPYGTTPTNNPYGTNPYGTLSHGSNPYGNVSYGTVSQGHQQTPPPPYGASAGDPYGTNTAYGGSSDGSAGLAGYDGPISYEQAEDAHRQVYHEERKAHLSHQLIAGAAAYEAVKAYRRHQEAKGEEVSHGFLKQSVAALAATQIVKFAEEHNWSSSEREEATRQAQAAADQYCTREFGAH